jgi:uncharacterized protein YdhG (YjbR/CyaY superfamily)
MSKSSAKPGPYGAVKFKTVDEYQTQFSGEVRTMLDELRSIILKTVPDAQELISYNMPAYKTSAMVAYYAGYKAHIGFYPTPGPLKELAAELTAYKTSKGAIQFPLDKPLPVNLVKKLLKLRLKEIAEKK